MSHYFDPSPSRVIKFITEQAAGKRVVVMISWSSVIQWTCCCSSCPCCEYDTSWLLLCGSSGPPSAHLQPLFSALQHLSGTAALPAPPQRSEQACAWATAGSNHGNRQFGPDSCFWICTGIERGERVPKSEGTRVKGEMWVIQSPSKLDLCCATKWEEVVCLQTALKSVNREALRLTAYTLQLEQNSLQCFLFPCFQLRFYLTGLPVYFNIGWTCNLPALDCSQ